MALSKLTLTNGKWMKISAAGESGSAWLKSYSGLNPIIVIAHSDQSITVDGNGEALYASTSEIDIDVAYRLPFKEFKISDPLTSDSTGDIFYATILNDSATCEIIVDFI